MQEKYKGFEFDSDCSTTPQAREELAQMPARVCGREVGLWLRSPKLSMGDCLTSWVSLMGTVRKNQEHGNVLQRKQEMEICVSFKGRGRDEESKGNELLKNLKWGTPAAFC